MYRPDGSLSEPGSLPGSEMLYICLCDAAFVVVSVQLSVKVSHYFL